MLHRNVENFIGCDSSYRTASIVLYGAPFDSTTSYRPGARFGPAAMRHESYGLETYSPYQDKDLTDGSVFDSGDLELCFGSSESALVDIESRAAEILRGALELANKAVYEQAQLSDDFAGMGTTLVAALVRGLRVEIVNIGDSRAYHLGADGIRCVTVDHSLVELMVQRGELTHEQAKNHPSKNLITRAVGTEKQVAADVFSLTAEPGDCLLLCSDGLSNQMADQEILFEVVHGAQKADCCQRLLDIAKSRGAPDNVTSVLIAL